MTQTLAASPASRIGGIIEWLKPKDTDNQGLSLERAGKGALVGGGLIGGLTAWGTVGLGWWKPHLNISPASTTARAALVAAVAMGELGMLSSVRLPEDRAWGTLVGAGLGTAALAGGGTVIATAVAPKLLRNGNSLAALSLGLGAAGAAIGGVIGLTGARSRTTG